MNKKLFKTVLLWALFALHLVCGTPVVGQTTTSVVPEVTFPSELPIGTNLDQKLRASATKCVVYAYVVTEIDGVREYITLTSKVGSEFEIRPGYSDQEVISRALPALNEMVEDGREKLNQRFGGTDNLRYAFSQFTLLLTSSGVNTRLYSAVWWRYYILNEDSLMLETPDLVEDEVELRPDYQNDQQGLLSFGITYELDKVMSITGVLIDAVDSEGVHDTSSSYLKSEGFEAALISFKVPARCVDGSKTGKLYLNIRSSEAFLAGRTVYDQVLAVDLQTGRIERPEIQVVGVSLKGPIVQPGRTVYQLRPNCLVPRGTSFLTQSSQVLDGVWSPVKSVTAGSGGDTPMVEFSTGVSFQGTAGFVKVVVDDDAYPSVVRKALPKP
jgi:hypothetical protein